MLARLESQVLPTHAVVVWDGGLDAERVEELDDYKAQRDPMPDDMEVQLDEMVEYLEAEGWASVCDDGVEADDRIGQLAKRAEAEGFEVAIASSDKDFLQLINDRVKMLNPADKSGVPMDAGAVVAKPGVRPEQIVDWLRLVGDAAATLPGVPGARRRRGGRAPQPVARGAQTGFAGRAGAGRPAQGIPGLGPAGKALRSVGLQYPVERFAGGPAGRPV